MSCPSWRRSLSAACESNVGRPCLIFKDWKHFSQVKKMRFSLLSLQDKTLHTVASPAADATWVQAERHNEGVPGERLLTTNPHGAPPLGTGPQVTEGPAGGAALRPEAGKGQSHHQRLRPVHSETSGRHTDVKGQVTDDERDVAPPRHPMKKHSSGGFNLRKKPKMEDAVKSWREARHRRIFDKWITEGSGFLTLQLYFYFLSQS